MKALTAEQIEAQKQLADEAKPLNNKHAAAGAIELSDDDLDQAAGGIIGQVIHFSDPFDIPTGGDLGDVPDFPTL